MFAAMAGREPLYERFMTVLFQVVAVSSPVMPPERVPTEIKLHQKSLVMEIAFGDGRGFHLSYEYLRVYSPSAEVRGHGPGQEVLQTGKREVEIRALEPVGSYAVQPVFSDGHSTGIYSWEYLYELGENHERLWSEYLAKLEKAGASRDK
jgi:DUF971 family protein